MPEYIALVDDRLKKSAPNHVQGLDRLLLATGKRFRPSLVITVAYYGGKEIGHDVITLATAVEMVHLASLIHDDIIDDDSERWGVETINAKEGSDSAILAGDYLFAKGCSLAANVNAEAGVLVAETIVRLCEGQAAEIKQLGNSERTEADLLEAILGKTASMFELSCKLGGIIAGLSRGDIDSIEQFARNIGIAYQYQDDLSDEDKDKNDGNYTLSAIKSRDYAATKIQEYTAKALTELGDMGNKKLADVLTNISRELIRPVL